MARLSGEVARSGCHHTSHRARLWASGDDGATVQYDGGNVSKRVDDGVEPSNDQSRVRGDRVDHFARDLEVSSRLPGDTPHQSVGVNMESLLLIC